jgi:CheY-like chemotaxis protein
VEHPEPLSLRGCTILVVEDDEEAGDLLKQQLELLGARVFVERNGSDGLRRLQAVSAHAVLCDLTMPVMDGLEFARRVRQSAKLRRMVLVAVTGRRDHSDFLATLDAGFDAHLVKPITLEMLQAFARRLAGRCGQQQSGA